MAISEEKMRIVIDNYFRQECDVNTSIRKAFEKGFRIGIKKGLIQATADTPQTEKKCDTCKHDPEPWYSDACDGCCGYANYEPKTEQTDCPWK